MATLEVFDPAMCCSTGVCGTEVDHRLAQVAADLEWLGSRGVEVARHDLARQPGDFVTNPTVHDLLKRWGPSCLPLFVREDRVLARGRYPTRTELAAWFALADTAP